MGTKSETPRLCFAKKDAESHAPLLPQSQTITLYHATPQTGTYSHHSHIVHHNGILYAAWSNHPQDEDAPGQRVLSRYSTDQGTTWSECLELFPPLDHVSPATEDGQGRRTQCSNGFASVENVLYALSEVWDDGGSCRTSGQGQLARTMYPDGQLGPLFWLRAEAPAPKAGLPAYPAGDPAVVEKICAFLRRPENERSWDFRENLSRPRADDGHLLCEPTPAWRLANGTWCKLHRDLGKSGFNYASFSYDDGITWTLATRTNFPDANSRSTAGVLPNSCVYVISNISPHTRDPLALSLARDGLNFDRVFLIRHGAPALRYEGRWKGTGFQYPHATEAYETLWVLYSVNKEDIHLTRIPLSGIQADFPA